MKYKLEKMKANPYLVEHKQHQHSSTAVVRRRGVEIEARVVSFGLCERIRTQTKKLLLANMKLFN